MSPLQHPARRVRAIAAPGFTLIEVLVAMVVVALGMGAVLGALTSAAGNVSTLRERTAAQWLALDLVADARLSLQVPTDGITEGDIGNFAGSNWHWQREIAEVSAVPGLKRITVRVRRTGVTTGAPSSSGLTGGAPALIGYPASGANTLGTGGSTSSIGTSGLGGDTGLNNGSTLGSSNGTLGINGTLGSNGTLGGSATGFGAGGGGTTQLNASSSGGSGGTGGSSGSSSGGSSSSSSGGSGSSAANQDWSGQAMGFRGDALAAASGDTPDWAGTSVTGTPTGGSTGTPTPQGPGATTGSSGGSGAGGSAFNGAGAR